MIKKISKIYKIIKSHNKKILPLILFFLIISILDLVGLGLIGPFISIAFNNDYQLVQTDNYLLNFKFSKEHKILIVSILVLFTYALKIIVSLKISKLVINFSQNFQVSLRLLFLKKIQKNSFNELSKNSLSEYLNIQQSVIPIFSNLLMTLIQFIGEALIASIIIIYLFSKNPLLFIELFALIILTIFVYDLYAKKMLVNAGKEANYFSAKMLNIIREGIVGYKEIKIFNKEKFIKSKLEENANGYANSQVNINFLNIIPRYLIELILVIAIVILALTINSLNLINQNDFLTTIGVFAFGSVRLLPIARNFSYTLNRINSSTDSINILSSHLNIFDNFNNGSGLNKNLVNFRKLEYQNINFSYLNRITIFKNLNLEIRKKDKILIKGKSGRGKTTLLNIIMGLLKVNSGEIYFNGRLIKNIESLNNIFAYLPQETFILNESIERNITMEEKELKNNRKLKESILNSGLSDLVESLPNKEKTILGENGQNLSGGQKQKIAIARAIYSKREVLVLDEATNALDGHSEEKIFNELSNNKNLTVIVVSHKNIKKFKYNKIFKL